MLMISFAYFKKYKKTWLTFRKQIFLDIRIRNRNPVFKSKHPKKIKNIEINAVK